MGVVPVGYDGVDVVGAVKVVGVSPGGVVVAGLVEVVELPGGGVVVADGVDVVDEPLSGAVVAGTGTVVVVVVSGETHPLGGVVAPCWPGMRTVPAQPKFEKVVSPVWDDPSENIAVETV